jgi:acyl carrier protein
MNSIENKIIKEIEILSKNKVNDKDQIIFGDGALLDSLNILHILIFIENEFNIKIDYNDLSRENFNTVNKIVEYVKGKLK